MGTENTDTYQATGGDGTEQSMTQTDESSDDSNSSSSNDGNVTFLTRVFAEKNNQVYGAEIILFDEYKNPLDSILITNESDFEEYKKSLDALKLVYTPFSQIDKTNLETILDYYRGDVDEDSYNSALDSMSHLQKIGDLESILYNKAIISDTEREEYNVSDDVNVKGDTVLINATHLDGLNSSHYSREGHTHAYLSINHQTEYANESNYGHVKVADNLNDNSTSGVALSANQGSVLFNKIVDLNSKNRWSNPKSIGKYMKYSVNTDLRLLVMDYNRTGYTGFKSQTGNIPLHGEGTIDSNYCPTSRVATPLYRGDVTLYYNTDGSVHIWSLTKLKDVNIHAQVMWHY